MPKSKLFRCPECGNAFTQETVCTGDPNAPFLDSAFVGNELRRHPSVPVAPDALEVVTNGGDGGGSSEDVPSMRWKHAELVAETERRGVDISDTATKAELVAALTEGE